MNLITAEHITHAYTERQLFDDVSFSLNTREKVGIIGINGTGKSTLLRILAGLETPDAGTITRKRNLRIGYLAQSPSFPADADALTAALPLASDISGNPAEYEPDARAMLTRLGIHALHQPVLELSGGQRKRIALARTLLTPADLLILDEPTNHLDSAMAEWLETFLRDTRNPLIMITHDRYFLDSVANRIVEIDHGKLYSYDCNYLGYLERKAQREEIARATERKRQSLLRTEIAWMQRGARARSTKQKAHIARYEALRDASAPETDDVVKMSSVSSRLGKTTVELEHLSKSYHGNVLIHDFSYIFLRHDRIGIIGPNGCGKSTLLKLIDGSIEPDSGSVKIGQTVRIGYFSQENESLDETMRVIDYIRDGAEYIRQPDGSLITASAMLEHFLFPPDAQYAPIHKLSGGEKRRLALLRILMEAPNVLFLDEPTNDLDISTLTILEDYLDHFDGIVAAVSHDRYFLDRIAHRIFSYEENGQIIQYEGGYTDYLHARSQLHGETSENFARKVPASPDNAQYTNVSDRQTGANSSSGKTADRRSWKDGQTHRRKMTYREQQDYETIENDIAALEAQIARLDQEMQASASDFVRLNELCQEKETATAALEQKMNRWLELEELAQQLETKR